MRRAFMPAITVVLAIALLVVVRQQPDRAGAPPVVTVEAPPAGGFPAPPPPPARPAAGLRGALPERDEEFERELERARRELEASAPPASRAAPVAPPAPAAPSLAEDFERAEAARREERRRYRELVQRARAAVSSGRWEDALRDYTAARAIAEPRDRELMDAMIRLARQKLSRR